MRCKQQGARVVILLALCAFMRRWTYFGDAFFNRSLREETSFRRAFARARRLIGLWEARDQLAPSSI